MGGARGSEPERDRTERPLHLARDGRVSHPVTATGGSGRTSGEGGRHGLGDGGREGRVGGSGFGRRTRHWRGRDPGATDHPSAAHAGGQGFDPPRPAARAGPDVEAVGDQPPPRKGASAPPPACVPRRAKSRTTGSTSAGTWETFSQKRSPDGRSTTWEYSARVNAPPGADAASTGFARERRSSCQVTGGAGPMKVKPRLHGSALRHRP